MADSNTPVTTNLDRVEFIKRQISHRRTVAGQLRKSAVNMTDPELAKETTRIAEGAERTADVQENVLRVLFPELIPDKSAATQG